MSNCLTQSRLRSYRECQRLHHLRYEEGFAPVVESESLRFGTLLHIGLEVWWKDGDWRGAIEENEADPFDRIRAFEIMDGYDARWNGERDRFQILAIEEQFTAPLLNPETGMPSRTWVLAGKCDGLIKQDGDNIVLEHKTTSDAIDSDADNYWQKLSMDHQLSLYVIGAESLGFQVSKCLYDVIRKPSIRPLKATPVEARKFTKDGRLYANQRETDETPEEFRERLRDEIQDNLEKYFQRRLVPRMESQIQDFLFDAWQTARQIREGEIAGHAPRNPEACHRFGRCPFWDVCANGLDPSTSQDFIRRENVHPELNFKEENNETADQTA